MTIEREDGDTHDETNKDVLAARKWLRSVAERSRNVNTRLMLNDLKSLELAASPYFLGLDYDFDDRDDVDELGPF